MVVNAASKCLDTQDTEIKWLDSKESDRAEPNLQIIKSCAQIAFMMSKLDGKDGAGLRDLVGELTEELGKAKNFWRIGMERHQANKDIIDIINGDCKPYARGLTEMKDALNNWMESNPYDYGKVDMLLQKTFEVLSTQVGLSRDIEQIFSGENGIDELVEKTAPNGPSNGFSKMVILDKVKHRIMNSKELNKVPDLEEIAERYVDLTFELKGMQSGRSLVEAVSRDIRDLMAEAIKLDRMRTKNFVLGLIARDFVVQKPSAEIRA